MGETKFTIPGVEFKRKREDEHAYLSWLAQNIDFGPAHEDVMHWLQAQYEQQTGRKVPENWKQE